MIRKTATAVFLASVFMALVVAAQVLHLGSIALFPTLVVGSLVFGLGVAPVVLEAYWEVRLRQAARRDSR